MKYHIFRFFIKIKQFFSDVNVKKEFSKLALEDKKGIILDQLTFNLSTIETLELLEMVNNEVKVRMDIKSKESDEIIKAIKKYYPDKTGTE